MLLWIIISFIILSFFCIFAIFKIYKRGDKIYGKSALSSYILFSIIFIATWIFKIMIPSLIIFCTILTVFLSCFCGHYLKYYINSKTFDRYLHAFGSFSFSLFFYYILSNYLDIYPNKVYNAIFIFLLGNTIGVIFELIEAFGDRKTKVKSQKGLKDTNMDMAFNVIGSLISAILAYFWIF